MREVWQECGTGWRDFRGASWVRNVRGCIRVLRSLDFPLWTMGSRGMIVNSSFAPWSDGCCCCCWSLVDRAYAWAAGVMDDLSPWNWDPLESSPPPTTPRHPPPSNLPLKNEMPAFLPLHTWRLVCPGLCPISTGWLSAAPFPGWGLIMRVLLCFIVQICVCDVVGTDK